MTIRGDSYGSAAEVVAFTRYLLAGQSTFNSTTRPTVTEVEKFIDRASGVLNVAISRVGFAPAQVRANSTARLECDDWVIARTAEYVELTQRGQGFGDEENQRYVSFRNMHKAAADFAKVSALGWQRLGVVRTSPLGEGLKFTGEDASDQRADPDDSTLRQPAFVRRQFDHPDLSNDGAATEGSI